MATPTKKPQKAHYLPRIRSIKALTASAGQEEVYGMVEEFLELSRRLSVQTIRDFVAAVHKRVPSMFLEMLS